MKFKVGDKVKYTKSKSMFSGLKGEVVEITNYPFDMYIVSFLDGVRLGISEKYLVKNEVNHDY